MSWVSLTGFGWKPWVAILLVIAKSTPASPSSTPLQKIVQLLSTKFPEPGCCTSPAWVRKYQSLLHSNSLQMMAAARSGLAESALSSVVLAFQAPRVRGSLLTFYADAQIFRLRWWYGLCVFLATVVRCGASVALNALTSIISASLIRHLHM